MLPAVLRIRDILVRIRIRGSVPLTSGSGFDPDPAISVSDLQDGTQKCLFDYYRYFIKLHLHHFSKIRNYEEVTKQ